MKITITETPHYGWCIESDGRFLSGLCSDELLGCIASLLYGGKMNYGGLRSYESEVKRKWGPFVPQEEIAGLLIYDPEAA